MAGSQNFKEKMAAVNWWGKLIKQGEEGNHNPQKLSTAFRRVSKQGVSVWLKEFLRINIKTFLLSWTS